MWNSNVGIKKNEIGVCYGSKAFKLAALFVCQGVYLL